MKTIYKQILFFIVVLVLPTFLSLFLSSDYRHSFGVNISDAQQNLPNLRFGSINVHSRKGTYDIIAFEKYLYSASLFSENFNSKNVRVMAGIVDGKILYDKTFKYISAETPKRIEFAYSMPVGTHTMYIEVDPENKIAEQNETDNRTTRTFIANLRIQMF